MFQHQPWGIQNRDRFHWQGSLCLILPSQRGSYSCQKFVTWPAVRSTRCCGTQLLWRYSRIHRCVLLLFTFLMEGEPSLLHLQSVLPVHTSFSFFLCCIFASFCYCTNCKFIVTIKYLMLWMYAVNHYVLYYGRTKGALIELKWKPTVPSPFST